MKASEIKIKIDKRTLNGGHKNCGRKKSDDPKLRIEIYVKTSIIDKNGGVDETKTKLLNFINQ